MFSKDTRFSYQTAKTFFFQLQVDLERQLKIQTQVFTRPTSPHSESIKQVLVSALTIPWEDRNEEAFERKLPKYKGLVSSCQQMSPNGG